MVKQSQVEAIPPCEYISQISTEMPQPHFRQPIPAQITPYNNTYSDPDLLLSPDKSSDDSILQQIDYNENLSKYMTHDTTHTLSTHNNRKEIHTWIDHESDNEIQGMQTLTTQDMFNHLNQEFRAPLAPT